MKSVVALSVFAGVALAANSSALIPSGISSGCSSYLTTLDSDNTIQSCTQPLIAATKAFAPGSNTTAASASAAVTSALSSLCASTGSSGCDATTVRNQLTAFQQACQNELTGDSPNADVLRTYDVLYALTPLTQVVCTKDDSGKYCVTETAASSSSNSSAKANFVIGGAASGQLSISNFLWTTVKGSVSSAFSRRGSSSKDSNSSVAIVPNTTTFRSSNLMFLYLLPSSPKSELCSTCSKNVLQTYTAFEQTAPYAASIDQSTLLGGQRALYEAVVDSCGQDFLGSGLAQAAGGLKGSSIGSGAVPMAKVGGAAVAVVVGSLLAVLAL